MIVEEERVHTRMICTSETWSRRQARDHDGRWGRYYHGRAFEAETITLAP